MADSPQTTQDSKLANVCTHQPFLSDLWQGRDEPHESARARYWSQAVKGYQAQSSTSIGIIGFVCDQGVRRNLGRVGAKNGPAAIRKAFAKLPISARVQDKFSPEQLTQLIVDHGDCVCHDEDKLTLGVLEQTQTAYSEQICQILQQHSKSLAIGLGGGHSIAYASYMGLWQALHPTDQAPHSSIGIINFDAHLDLRQAPTATSGTPFRQMAEHNQNTNQSFHYFCIGVSQYANTAALFDRAHSLGVTTISDDECYRLPWHDIVAQLDQFMQNVACLYLTIDMDCFPASMVPGVSAPAAKGITLDFVERCLTHIIISNKVKVIDIAELNPIYDIDERSAKVAARLLALIIEQHLISQINQTHLV